MNTSMPMRIDCTSRMGPGCATIHARFDVAAAARNAVIAGFSVSGNADPVIKRMRTTVPIISQKNRPAPNAPRAAWWSPTLDREMLATFAPRRPDEVPRVDRGELDTPCDPVRHQLRCDGAEQDDEREADPVQVCSGDNGAVVRGQQQADQGGCTPRRARNPGARGLRGTPRIAAGRARRTGRRAGPTGRLPPRRVPRTAIAQRAGLPSRSSSTQRALRGRAGRRTSRV